MASDAFGAASDGLRRYAEAVRSVQAGSARAVALMRQAASMAPTVVPPPRAPLGPSVQAISWGHALDKVAGAGKAAVHGVEDGASAVGHGAESTGKVLARGGEVVLEGGEGDLLSALGFVDDLDAAMDGTAHQLLSSMGETAEQVWSGLERVAAARPGAAPSLQTFEQWESWFGQLGLAVSAPMAQGALKGAVEASRGALAVGRALTTDAGRYREIAAQRECQPIKGGPTYDKIHRTAKSDHHILVGSARGGGGHKARAGWPGKTEFPTDWDDAKILGAVDTAARTPTREMTETVGQGRKPSVMSSPDETGGTVESASRRSFSEPDSFLLPYWLAGRVDDDARAQAFLFLGQEDEMMRDMLGVAIRQRSAPFTARERDALLMDSPTQALRDLLAETTTESADVVTDWMRQEYQFGPGSLIDDDSERCLLSVAQAAKGILCVGVAVRRASNGSQKYVYVCVLDASVRDQVMLRIRIESAFFDLDATSRRAGEQRPTRPLFESIRQGWDWPVYYRDMVANSQLIWSASGEDIDLRALAESQPHEI
jgi:hypothetical protein